MSQSLKSFYVGDWFIEPALQRISKNGTIKKVEPQLMAVLQQLAINPGSVVSKDELKETVWADVIVTENVLTRAISSLRKILEDDRSEPIYIETISKTGYRLIAKVKGASQKQASDTFTIRLARKPVVTTVGILILVALGAFATRQIFLPISTEKTFHPNAIANYSTAEYWPAISPDGRFVAYSWRGQKDDNWDIYAKLIGTETVLRITDHNATELRPKWSPDGNYVYYLRYSNGGSTIFKKPVVGGEEIRIITSPTHSYGDFDISPDEKWISFNDRPYETGALRIKLISLENESQKWLTNPSQGINGDIHPRFSPDGRKLAFIREGNSASMQLYQIDLQSENVELLTEENISINGFDWSDEGTSLIYSSDRTGIYKLWEYNFDSRESILMPAGDYQMVMPRMSNSGRIVYAKMVDNVNIWSYDIETKTAKAWYANNNLNLNPVPSPDGNKACFTMLKDGKYQIWTSNSDGSQAIPITNFVGKYLSAPSWSPNSEEIIFQGFLNGQADIFKVNALGGVPENLTSSKADEHTPYYTTDGKIYYSSNKDSSWSTWKMEKDGSNASMIVEDAYAPQLSSSNEHLYYCKKEQMGLWQIELSTGTESQLIEDFHPMFWGAFAVAESGIYYLNSETKRFEFFDFISRKSKIVYQPQRRIPRLGTTLSLSADGKKLFFSQIDTHDSDIMLLQDHAL